MQRFLTPAKSVAIRSIYQKNRDRAPYSFANINLLGKCNVDCFFCLGKDIEELLSKHNQLRVHFREWKRFGEYLELCAKSNIKNIYITGQNTDSLLYEYLGELIDELQSIGFDVGLRTNGYLALKKAEAIRKCRKHVGYSIHSLDPATNNMIMKRRDIPDWRSIFDLTNECRVSIVVNRYNVYDIIDIIDFLKDFDSVKYIQLRRISTDTRMELLHEDIELFEWLHKSIDAMYPRTGEYYLAPRYDIYGKEVTIWRTVETSVNSMNYFTDGTVSNEYFVVEGYLKNRSRDGQ